MPSCNAGVFFGSIEILMSTIVFIFSFTFKFDFTALEALFSFVAKLPAYDFQSSGEVLS